MHGLNAFLLLKVTPFVVLASWIEAWVLARRTRTQAAPGARPAQVDWAAMGVSAVDLITRTLVNLFVPLALSTPVTAFARAHRVMDLGLAGPGSLLLLFLGQEFCYYWYHRAAHRVRWFWCSHAVHHSPNELNLAAAYRIGIFGKATGTFMFFAPLVWLGFEPQVVGAALGLNLLYQFWIHATWLPKLGWLEGVLNTPSAHRVHHASHAPYLDANYGGVLIIFDRLFGTYVAEREDLPPRYGLVHPILSHNPLVLWSRPWLDLWRDMRACEHAWQAPALLFMPPDWRPGQARSRPLREPVQATDVSGLALRAQTQQD